MKRIILVFAVLTLAVPVLAVAETVSVRIRFGVTDTEPSEWRGAIDASGGTVTGLDLWRPRPDLAIDGLRGFRLQTIQGPNFGVPPDKPVQPLTDRQTFIVVPGIVVTVEGGLGTILKVNTNRGDFPVDLSRIAAGDELRFLEDAVVADLVPTVEKISTAGFEDEYAAILPGEDGAALVAWTAWKDGHQNQVLARRRTTSGWGPTQEITGPADAFLVKLAHDRHGRAWAIWSDQIDGNRDLYASREDGDSWSKPERLTSAPQPDIYHEAISGADGHLWVVWQGFRDGKSDIFARAYDGESWSPEQRVSTSPANDWNPSVAVDGRGSLYVAWDTFDKGDYNLALRRFANGEWGDVTAIADTPKFEAHVSIACDAQDRLWAVWNESGMLWGKDTGYGLYIQGTPLYNWRDMKMAVLTPEGWMEPVADLDGSLPEELREWNDFPQLVRDGDGRMWVFFRHRTLKIRDVYPQHEAHRAAWEIYGTAFDGRGWSRPINFPDSSGRMDMRWQAAVAPDGRLHAAWPTDGRDFAAMLHKHADIFTAEIPAPPSPVVSAELQPRVQPKLRARRIHPNEEEDTRRIRAYTIESGGKRYKIYRGDTHRHTEFSMDGHNDGSLLETYRYAMDPGALDYLGVSEHNFIGGPELPYINFVLQQAVDIYRAAGTFETLFVYERSVRNPHGHRNIIFTKRGNPTFLISKEEFGGQNFPFTTDETMKWSANPEPVGTKDLYQYLKKYNGISIPHTSATRGMGTDWRDNDPEVEPLVEIYQGDRTSAEYEGAPRAGLSGYGYLNPGGFQAEGTIWNAWSKGYKIGIQASSDHLSTHISYACTIAEEFTREGLVDAMRKRHSYGATDNIILDYRLESGGREYLQGDIATAAKGFRLSVNVVGTAPIRQIDVIRNQEFVHNLQNLGREAKFTYMDTQPPAGETYYYVRVQQADGQIAWSSPIWVTVN